jgi:hypothetical protein
MVATEDLLSASEVYDNIAMSEQQHIYHEFLMYRTQSSSVIVSVHFPGIAAHCWIKH